VAQRHVVCMSANQETDLSTLTEKDNSCALTMERILDRDLADLPTPACLRHAMLPAASSQFSGIPFVSGPRSEVASLTFGIGGQARFRARAPVRSTWGQI
jgi:hypothetical protein